MLINNIEINPEMFKTSCPVYTKFSEIILETMSIKTATPEALYLTISTAATALIQYSLDFLPKFHAEEFRKHYFADSPKVIITPKSLEALPMFQNINNPQSTTIFFQNKETK